MFICEHIIVQRVVGGQLKNKQNRDELQTLARDMVI